MGIVVQKYGGSSVADADRIRLVAGRVAELRATGAEVVVVVSAMGDTTDHLLGLAAGITGNPDRRELDMLLTAGERISMALLAMALIESGLPAVSLTGSQAGIITDGNHAGARIIEVRPARVLEALAAGKVAVVAGYQGVSRGREVTTLGRGGSDTTAVALAAALKAERCEIWSDVKGVFTTDPRLVDDARVLPRVGYPVMQEMAAAGAKVLNPQAVEFAKRAEIVIWSGSSFDPEGGTLVDAMDDTSVRGNVIAIAFEERVKEIVLRTRWIDEWLDLLGTLEQEGVGSKQLTYNVLPAGGYFSLIVSPDDLHRWGRVTAALSASFGTDALFNEECGAVSMIGEGINATKKNLIAAAGCLMKASIPIRGVHTSSYRITLLVPGGEVRRAVGLLHERFIESRAEE